jgi:hypothetical protein
MDICIYTHGNINMCWGSKICDHVVITLGVYYGVNSFITQISSLVSTVQNIKVDIWNQISFLLMK